MAWTLGCKDWTLQLLRREIFIDTIKSRNDVWCCLFVWRGVVWCGYKEPELWELWRKDDDVVLLFTYVKRRRCLSMWRGVYVEKLMFMCVKRRRWLAVWRGEVVYVCEEEKMCISEKRKKIDAKLWRGWIRNMSWRRDGDVAWRIVVVEDSCGGR